MHELFERLYAPDRYYRLAADDIRQSIARQVAAARSENERDLRAADDPWVLLDPIDVVGIPDVGILVFFRLPQTGSRIHVYVADVRSFADLERARAMIDAGQDASQALGEGYDVFDDDFIFSFPAFARHVDDVMSVSRTQFFTLDEAAPRERHTSSPAVDQNDGRT
jgi:hypothetical protein